MDNRNGVFTLRSVGLASHTLGFTGIADVIELTLTSDNNNTIKVPKHPGNWHVIPIEYKHGRPKREECDDLQLCAQAMCLEEMFNITLTEGCLFYAASRRRKKIVFNIELREQVVRLSKEMHNLMDCGMTPKAVWTAKCKSCSLKDLCMLGDLQRTTSVNYYLKQLYTNEEAT